MRSVFEGPRLHLRPIDLGLHGSTGPIATISRKLDDPLAVAIQSSSAAGKSSLMEAVLDFVPED